MALQAPIRRIMFLKRRIMSLAVKMSYRRFPGGIASKMPAVLNAMAREPIAEEVR